MQVTVTVPDAIIREAEERDCSLTDLIESLINKGIRAAEDRPNLERAMAQFRALRAAKEAGQSHAA